MQVVMNGLATLKPKTGVGQYVAELHAALTRQYRDEVFTLYPGEWLGKAAKRLGVGKPKSDGTLTAQSVSRFREQFRRITKSVAKCGARWHFTGFTRTFGFDIYHEPNFVPFRSALPTVVTVHDLSVLKFPDWHPADRVREHQKHFLRGLDRAQHVIVVSDTIKRELVEELNCPSERVTTVQNGIGSQFVRQPKEVIDLVRTKWDLPDHFFLCVGTIEPRKNLSTVIRAFAELPTAIRTKCPLVLVGPWGWQSDTIRELYTRIGQPAGVRHIGFVPGEDLPSLYTLSNVLLYPSYYEGFGFPPLEMLACGGAVIASTADAIREVVGRHAFYLDPDDVSGWRDAMLRSATDSSFVTRLRTDGIRHASHYNWSRAAAETMAVYEKVLAARGGASVRQPASSGLAA